MVRPSTDYPAVGEGVACKDVEFITVGYAYESRLEAMCTNFNIGWQVDPFPVLPLFELGCIKVVPRKV